MNNKLILFEGEGYGDENPLYPHINQIYTFLAEKLNSSTEINKDADKLIKSLFVDIVGFLAIKRELGELDEYIGSEHRPVFIPCNIAYQKTIELDLFGKYQRNDLVSVIVKKAVEQIAETVHGIRVQRVEFVFCSHLSVYIFIENDIGQSSVVLTSPPEPK